MDRISQLPDFIVHQILSSLHASPAHLVRMSVLSKKWFNLTASFPVLGFNILYFTNVLHLSRQTFFNYVDYTTSRFCLQNLPAHEFNLITTLQEPAEVDVVNRCLELLLNKGVNVLEIDITNLSDVQNYRLPNVLLSVSVLKSLTVRGCHLPSSLMLDALKFKSLTQLSLQNVHIDDEGIKRLTTSCPLLQDFDINKCHGFKTLCVSGHQHLQKVLIIRNPQLERIDIEAPNLSCLGVSDRGEIGAPQMNVASCKKLTRVAYFGHPSPDSNAYNDFLSSFPSIENLALVTKDNNNKLKLSSHSLRSLLLHSNYDLEAVEFSTPNLRLFIYSQNFHLLTPLLMRICWSLLRPSIHLKACMHCYPDSYVDTLWFQKFRQFLDKKNGFKVFNLYIHAKYSQKFTELEKLKAIELPPYELEHVELELETHEESLAHVAFVDAVLWCCRPRSLTLRSSVPLIEFREQSDVVKFTCEKLLQQEDQGHTSIQIVWPSSPKAQNHLRNLKSMALPCEGRALSFIKEEVVQEAG